MDSRRAAKKKGRQPGGRRPFRAEGRSAGQSSSSAGTLPPLDAYPKDQRGRIDTMLKGLKLRLPDGSEPAPVKA